MKSDNLIEERKELLSRIETYFNEKYTGTCQFLGGSLAAGNSDEFSDIDFRVVVKDKISKEEILDDFFRHFQTEIAFVETLTSFYGVFHFWSFIKVDLFVYYFKDLSPSVWLKNIKIIQDNKGFLSRVKAISEELNTSFTSKELNQYLSKYTAYLHELYRRHKRLESNYCEHCALMMKHILVSLWLVERGHTPNDLGDWSKYEGKRSLLEQEKLDLIHKYTPVLASQMNDFIKTMNQEILDVAEKLDLATVGVNHYSKLFQIGWFD